MVRHQGQYLPVIHEVGQEIFDALKECSWIELEDGIDSEWSKNWSEKIEKIVTTRELERGLII